MELSTRKSTYELYLKAWADVSNTARTSLLNQSVSSKVRYLDAMTERRGLAELALHLKGFQERRHGHSFLLTSMLVFNNEGLARWSLLGTDGNVVVQGYDVLRFGAKGKIEEIIGFADVPALRAN